MTKKRKTTVFIIIAIVLVLAIIGGVIFMLGRNYVSIKGQHLNKYNCSSGGGMNGGYVSETVKRYDESHALITTEKADWYYQDPTVNEYLVDVSIMDELETIVRKYRMNFWDGKNFSNMFIADGETTGYSFDFDEEGVSFSSQYYPERYSKKLEKLDEVVDKYIQSAEKLPGLVNDRINDEENYLLPEGEFSTYVYSYANDTLGVRILNGTDDEKELSRSYKLINTDTNKVIDEKEEEYPLIMYPQTQDEMSIKLNERLEKGNYKLIIGDKENTFEIR